MFKHNGDAQFITESLDWNTKESRDRYLTICLSQNRYGIERHNYTQRQTLIANFHLVVYELT